MKKRILLELIMIVIGLTYMIVAFVTDDVMLSHFALVNSNIWLLSFLIISTRR